jgi:Sulfatase
MSTAALMTYALAVMFWVLTACYGLLASQAFIVEQFLQPGLFAPLTMFAGSWWIAAPVVLALWIAPRVSLLRDVVLSATATVVGAVLIAGTVVVTGGLDAITGPLAAWLSAASLVMLWLTAASEQPAVRGALPRGADPTAADFWACALASICAIGIEVVVLFARDGAAESPGATAVIAARTQVLAGMIAFLLLTVVRSVASLTSRAVVAEARLLILAIGLVLGWFIDSVMMSAISVGGVLATVAAYAGGYVLAVAITAPALVRLADKTDGVRSVAGAFAPRVAMRGFGFGVWVVVAAILAVGFDAASRLADWNFVLARVGVVTVWLCLLGAAIRFVRVSGGSAVFVVMAVAVLAAHVALERFSSPVAAASPTTPAARWAVNLLRPSAEGPSGLFSLLQAHTNITGDTNGRPVDVSWAPLTGAPSAVRPHIFLFVVDSLRRDYLEPYNARATFTPSISAFARDSLVFDRAFTQYGATGLSVPSIWTGGNVLHKQYVTPYAPMNALAKLLTHEQYDQWLSVDNIVEVIAPAAAAANPLDRNTPVKDFRFCATLDEVRARLAERGVDDGPVFVYSLPQDVHISVITREGSRSVDQAAYEGFFAPVASRVRRFDGCFGAFVDELKRLGLYDESVIVLTSDHGDSLGEEGRMGHAYTLYPEIARIPLIVHVPASMRGRWQFDPSRTAYTTDLTPTLYRLLGHEPVPPGPFYGESLALETSQPAGAARDRMIASSYGSVYGAVLRGGSLMYVADAIERRELAFSFGPGVTPGQRVEVGAAIRREGTDVITTTVESIAKAYQFAPR